MASSRGCNSSTKPTKSTRKFRQTHSRQAENCTRVSPLASSVCRALLRGFNSLYCDKRLYNMDMASFAMRASFMGGAIFKQSSKHGHIEAGG